MNKHLGGAIPNPPFGDVGTWAPEIWHKIIKDYKIESVADIGCGYGYSTQYFFERMPNVIGVEGDKRAILNTIFKGKIIEHDYTQGKVFNADEQFDLIWSCEFVEHVEAKYEYNFLQDFSKGKYITMTHAIPGQPGYHHVNCQTAEYWIDKIENLSYTYNKEYTLELRKIINNLINNSVFPHALYLKTLLFFEKTI